MKMISFKKKLAALALGSTSLAVIVGTDGCWNAFVGDVVGGVEKGIVGAGVGALFGAIGNENITNVAQQPILDAFGRAIDDYNTVQYPSTAVAEEIFSR